jgi:hypothetical protein
VDKGGQRERAHGAGFGGNGFESVGGGTKEEGLTLAHDHLPPKGRSVKEKRNWFKNVAFWGRPSSRGVRNMPVPPLLSKLGMCVLPVVLPAHPASILKVSAASVVDEHLSLAQI